MLSRLRRYYLAKAVLTPIRSLSDDVARFDNHAGRGKTPPKFGEFSGSSVDIRAFPGTMDD